MIDTSLFYQYMADHFLFCVHNLVAWPHPQSTFAMACETRLHTLKYKNLEKAYKLYMYILSITTILLVHYFLKTNKSLEPDQL